MQATRQRSMSSASTKSKASMHTSEYRPASGGQPTALQPCTSNNRFFMFSQGSSILCVRQDTLELERRFEAHAANISLISADTYSENEIPQVISLDVNKEAVVWDPNSGDEIARFTAYEEIKVATFMKNGTIALGDAMGNIILFDPIRSEAVSCRTFQSPICAIAPSADNNFFGIGYADGTMIIATLMPTFIIHHTLSQATDFGVTNMAWHGSSSRQKSDMLATQTDDGDLKVWSIAKPIDGGEAARIVRVLKKPENYGRSRNWMSWSRNGRIVQYCDSETAIWDVRTKRVVWEPVPTSDNIVGLSVFGGKGQLFTLGKDHTVQQYSLYPPELVANVQHLPIAPPPSPPISEGSERKRTSDNDADMNKQVSYPPQGTDERPSSKGSKHSSKESGSRPASKQDHQQPQPQRRGSNRSVDIPRSMTPLGQIAQELEAIENMEKDHMSAISMSRTTSLASNASAHSRKNSAASVSSVKSYNSMTGSETSSLSSVPRRFHPLSKEVGTLSPIPMSPDTPKAPNQGTLATPRFAQAPPAELSPPVESEASDFYEQQGYFVPNPTQMDIFANLRAKISNVMFQTPLAGVDRPKYEDEMRKEMFRVVFGWQGDVLGLIREELEAIPPRSLQAIILKIWLGELDQNALAVLMGSDMLVSSDWMFVALSAMSGTKGWQQCMRVFVMRLIQRGDLHTAVTCLIALGDKKDALDLYVSNKRYMEAVILCGLISGDWRKLSSLVRKWGEHAAENGEGGLAMRCFACTESSDFTPPLPSATFSTKSGTFPQSPKSPKMKLGIMRPNSPPSSVMHSLTGGAARLFGFGDKNKEKENLKEKEKEREREREKEKENEANIMEMPWNKPAEPGLIESPKSPGLPGMPMDNEFRDMSISGPMTTTPIEMRVGTPVLPRITSPGLSRSATPGSINSVGSFRMGSPAPSMTQQRQSPIVPPQRTVSPRPAGVTPIVRTVSPRPQLVSQFEEPAGAAANNALPLQRVASPPITQVASMAPPVAPIKIANPPPPRSMTPRSAEQSKSGNAGRKPQGLQIQLATFSDVLAGEPSPELTRSTKSFSHRPTKSVGDSIKRDAAPSRSGRERFREERNEPTTTDDEEMMQQQQRREKNKPSKKTIRTPEESEDYDSEQDEEIERKLRERRRSLERLEREMGDLKIQRAQNISRNMNRAPSRNANLRRKDTYSTNDDESAEDMPRRRRANTVSDVSDADQDYRPMRTPRAASRNANRTPKPRYRQQDDEDFVPPRRIASPSMRAPSRSGRTPKPRRGDISEEEEEEMLPRRVLSPVHRTGSRATSRTPRPRQAPLTSDSEEMPPPPPRRTASRATTRTPKPRYEPSASESEEVPPPPRMASRNAFRRQYTEPDMIDQEWDDRERERNNRSRNALRRSKSESRARHYANDYDDFNPRLPRSPNSGLPSNPSISRSNTPALPRSKTPAVPPLPEMRSTTPAVGPGSHRRNASVGEIARPLSPPQGKLPPVPRSQTPKVPQDASVPDYDRHDYDLPALAAASQGQMAQQQRPAGMNDDLKSTLPQHLKSRFAALPPTPESPMGIPSDLPLHPAFAGNMRATAGQRRKPTIGSGPLSRSQTISPGPEDGGNNYVLSPGGKQALRMHSGPGRDDMITVGLSGVVMDDKGAPVETAPPPRAGRMTPMGQKI